MNKHLKDKIILVFYVSVDALDDCDIGAYIEEFNKIFSNWNNDDSVEKIIVPTRNGESSKVECINPVLLDAEKYAEVEEIVNEFKMKMNEFFNENNKNGKTGN